MNLELQSCSGRHPAARAGSPFAVRGLNIQVAQGEQVALIGPSGAGKTTALHLMACALKPLEGQVLLNGQSPWDVPSHTLQKLRRTLFLAPQVPPLPPRQRVVTAVLAGQLPQMGLWRSLRSLFYPVDIPSAHAALEQFDLSEKLFERVDHLSGGERQRVGLARALASCASLFLIDEPLSALDPSRAEQAMGTLTRSAREREATLVATLHQVDMALRFFPRIIGLREGQLAFDLPASQVTEEVLGSLYAQHLDELHGPAPDLPPVNFQPPPVVMQCR